jgi:hypothetical protein
VDSYYQVGASFRFIALGQNTSIRSPNRPGILSIAVHLKEGGMPLGRTCYNSAHLGRAGIPHVLPVYSGSYQRVVDLSEYDSITLFVRQSSSAFAKIRKVPKQHE